MKLRTLFLALALATAFFAKAEIITVVFYTNDGQKIGYSISEKPVCKYTENNTRLLVTTTSTEMEYEVENLQKFVFSDEIINKIDEAPKKQGKLDNKGGILTFEGNKKGVILAVYTPDGVLVAKTSTDSAGKAQLSLQNQPKGVYIVKAGKTSLKITKQ